MRWIDWIASDRFTDQPAAGQLVPGVRGVECDREALLVADLTDHDDVGVLPQDVTQGVRERVSVMADLALVDQAAVVAMEVLDRILDRDDLACHEMVQVVDHRGHGRGLARPRGTRDQEQAMVLLDQLAQDIGQPQRLERGDRHRHEAEGGAHRPTLAAEIDAVARRAGDAEGDVELQLAVELVAPHGLQHGLRQVLEIGGGA